MKQCDRILKYIHDFGSINPQQAMYDLGVMRLAQGYMTSNKAGSKSQRGWYPPRTDMGSP